MRQTMSFWAGVSLALFTIVFPGNAFAQAVTDSENFVNPFYLEIFVPCANGGTGELVVFSGDVHVALHSTVNGNRVRITQHYNPQGLTGVGQATGDIYHATGLTRWSADDVIEGTNAVVYSAVNIARMIGPGPNNNLMLHDEYLVTVTPDGNVTVVPVTSSVVCR